MASVLRLRDIDECIEIPSPILRKLPYAVVLNTCRLSLPTLHSLTPFLCVMETTSSTQPTSLPTPERLQDVPEKDKQEAARLKALANKSFTSIQAWPLFGVYIMYSPESSLFSDNDFTEATRLYSAAIELNPIDPTLWCNRAYSRMKLEEFGFALNDASQYFIA
jgi:hypothetical protein